MAKRLQVNFHRPGPSSVSEDGQPRPCAMGVVWVNPDTLKTIRKRHIPRTDPQGRPLVKQFKTRPDARTPRRTPHT